MQRRLPQRHAGAGRHRGALRAGACRGGADFARGVGRRRARHVVLRPEGRHRHGVAHRGARRRATTRWARWCSPISAGSRRLTLAGRRIGPALARDGSPTRRRAAARPAARSSSCSRPTRRSTIASCAGSRRAPPPASAAPARSTAMAAATSRSRSRPPHTVPHEPPQSVRDVRVLAETAARAAVRGRGRSDRAGDRRRAVRRGDRHRIRAATSVRARRLARLVATRLGRRSHAVDAAASARRPLPRRASSRKPATDLAARRRRRRDGGRRSTRRRAAASSSPRRSRSTPPRWPRALGGMRRRSSSARCSSAAGRTRCSIRTDAKGRPDRVTPLVALIDDLARRICRCASGAAASLFGDCASRPPDTNDGKELSGLCRALDEAARATR